jgi:hypothetical protein
MKTWTSLTSCLSQQCCLLLPEVQVHRGNRGQDTPAPYLTTTLRADTQHGLGQQQLVRGSLHSQIIRSVC